MLLQTIPVGPLQCNCSIVGDEAAGTAVVIDPGDDAAEIAALVAQAGLRVTHILHTHAHIDHIGGSADFQRRCGGEAWLHKGDQWLHEHFDVQCRMIGLPVPDAVVIAGWLEEGRRFDAGGGRIEVLHTPGHTPGSCSFVLEAEGRQVLFAGDTLFAGSIGRTDLWGGDTELILRSLHGKLMALDDDTDVVAGHGPGTTVGRERRGNPFLAGGSGAGFRA
jgi:glyoxylase-like metal-dependent hydrolase (beta-lactamase superfamily II)